VQRSNHGVKRCSAPRSFGLAIGETREHEARQGPGAHAAKLPSPGTVGQAPPRASALVVPNRDSATRTMLDALGAPPYHRCTALAAEPLAIWEMVSMSRTQVSGALAHPLTLLIVGALISSYLLPFVTQRWENQQQEHALKVGLVSEISQSTTAFAMAIQFQEVSSNFRTAEQQDRRQQEYDAAYMDFQIKSAVVRAKLEAYFPDTEIAREWARLSETLELLYAASGVDNPEARVRFWRDIRAKLGTTTTPVDWDVLMAGQPRRSYEESWEVARDVILSRVAELIRRILHSPGVAFGHGL